MDEIRELSSNRSGLEEIADLIATGDPVPVTRFLREILMDEVLEAII